MLLDKIVLVALPLIILINYFLIKNYKLFFLFMTKDDDFHKPQAFHNKATPRAGGFLIYIFFMFFIFFFLEKNYFFLKIFSLGSIFFLIGFLGDLKFKIKPQVRLFLMLVVSFFLIYFFEIQIIRTQFAIIDYFINSHRIISAVFICLCIVFICNGCNFIDGFNGLLIIHSMIILSILYFINYQNSNDDLLKYLIIFLLCSSVSVLFFNFPRAKIFLGDGGAYFLGIIISLIVIQLSNINQIISPFFFASILFYIFFEVFFSFFRKIFLNASPLKPDNKHLHMLFYKWIFYKLKNRNKANYLTGVFINIFYFIMILPLLFNYKNMTFCKIYFFILLNMYLLSYYVLKEKSIKSKIQR
jgi:UDP-N-acetylmuramyl pentapeptide phosphotransferase/UDP-N-acetylglucosamine-1-phosphate transferase